ARHRRHAAAVDAAAHLPGQRVLRPRFDHRPGHHGHHGHRGAAREAHRAARGAGPGGYLKESAVKRIVLLALVISAPVLAQTPQAAWKATLEKAKGQTLVMNNQGNKAFDTLVETFSKKFGIKVEATVARPSSLVARVKTEQSNGQYGWDVWWAITSNMVNVAAPAGMLSKIDDYLILPEVRDAANWRHADYMYGEPGRHVFTHSHELDLGSFRNRELVPDTKGDPVAMLLDPRLKGRIAVRDASEPNAGAFNLAAILKAKGPEF